MSGLGIPIERLAAIARKHMDALREGEAIALQGLAFDDDVSPAELIAFFRYRAASQLRTAFRDDPAALQAFLHSADFQRIGLEL